MTRPEYDPGFIGSHCHHFPRAHAERLLVALETARSLSLGTPTVAETGIVVGSRLGFGARAIAQLLAIFEVNNASFGPLHAEEALRAYDKFGKGRHRAGLNYGDCSGKIGQEPLLCVGQDFVHTDLRLADY